MSKVVVLNNQSIVDLSIQEFGTIEAMLELAITNNKSITEVIEPGEKLLLPEATQNKAVLNYYKSHNLMPATSIPFGGAVDESTYSDYLYVEHNYWE